MKAKNQVMVSQDIDKTLIVVQFIGELVKSIKEKLEDKKLSWPERFQLIWELRPLVNIIKNRKELVLELKDLDLNEIMIIATVIVKSMNVSKEKAKIITECALAILENILKIIEVLS